MSHPTRECGYCHQQQPWIWNGRRLKDGSKVYVDEEGKRWSGKRCPHCERHRVQRSVQCDPFVRANITRQLTQDGFEVKTNTLPIRVSKGEKDYAVEVQRAQMQDGQIVLDRPLEGHADLVAVVFETVRICTREQLEAAQQSNNSLTK